MKTVNRIFEAKQLYKKDIECIIITQNLKLRHGVKSCLKSRFDKFYFAVVPKHVVKNKVIMFGTPIQVNHANAQLDFYDFEVWIALNAQELLSSLCAGLQKCVSCVIHKSHAEIPRIVLTDKHYTTGWRFGLENCVTRGMQNQRAIGKLCALFDDSSNRNKYQGGDK